AATMWGCGICPKPATAFARACGGLCHARGASALTQASRARGVPRGSIGFASLASKPPFDRSAGGGTRVLADSRIRTNRARETKFTSRRKFSPFEMIREGGAGKTTRLPGQLGSRRGASVRWEGYPTPLQKSAYFSLGWEGL